MIDLDRLRQDTPGCARVIHLNNAGAALMPSVVLETVKAHLDLEAMIGGYEAARQESSRIGYVYDSIAALIGCHRNEIAVVENATRAWDMAFYAIRFQPGDRILTSRAEYASNLIAHHQVARKTGAVIEVIPNDENGQVDVVALEAMMDARVKLVSITHIPTNGGLVNPAVEIGQVTRAHGALYLLDACQSVGQMPVNVSQIGCDILSATSRKYLRGPRGMGFLYVRRDLVEMLEPPFLDLHAATMIDHDRYEIDPSARRFENWESNLAAKLGLGAAIDYALEIGLDAIWNRVRLLADGLRLRLVAMPGVQVHDLGAVRCGIISITVNGISADTLRLRMIEQGINTNVSRAPSTMLDMTARGIQELLRVSLHYYNSEAELETFCVALEAIQAEFRSDLQADLQAETQAPVQV